MDEYSPTLHYIEGPRNVIADTFSRLSHQDDTSGLVGKEAIVSDSAYYSFSDDKSVCDCFLNLPCFSSNKIKRNWKHKNKKKYKDGSKLSLSDLRCDHWKSHADKRKINDHCHHLHNLTASKCHQDHCYLNLPEDMLEDNPLDIENIKEKQQLDNELQQSATKYPDWYSRKRFNDVTNVLCYTKPGDDPANWKIALPKELIGPTVKWYHQVTGHPGSKRLYEQIKQRYYHRDIRRYIDHFNCDYCQRNKLDGKGYGHLPEREVRSIPFEECAVDLIGPWVVQVRGNPYEFDTLTVIDTVTNLVELIRIGQNFRYYCKKICPMLAITLSLATKMCA